MISKDYLIIKGNLYNIVKGIVIAINDDDTYDVEIYHTRYRYPHVKNVNKEMKFEMGDMLKIGIEKEYKMMPIIVGKGE